MHSVHMGSHAEEKNQKENDNDHYHDQLETKIATIRFGGSCIVETQGLVFLLRQQLGLGPRELGVVQRAVFMEAVQPFQFIRYIQNRPTFGAG